MSDDKLQKSESAIEVAGNIGEAITRALPQDEIAETFFAENTPSPKMAPVQQFNRCIANPDDSIGPHDCPGGMAGSDGKMYFCKCSCSNCLTAERLAANNESDKRGVTEIATMINGAVMTVTDDRTCIGVPRGVEHTGCPVVVTSDGGSPTICLCDCIDCKRLWFSDGRPVVRDGKIVRTTPETRRPGINAMFQSAEAARIERVLGDDTSAIDQLLDAEIFDAVEPSIPFTVEPLNPVLRAEGSREIAPLADRFTRQGLGGWDDDE